MRCRVKVCGITSVEDALMVSESGADAIGLVFYAKSPRHVEIEQAATIVKALPPFVTSVGLFLNADEHYVQAVLEQVSLDLLQFHGTESADFCRSFGRPYIKALGMKDKAATEFASMAAPYHDALGLLVDSHETGAAGGTGQIFDWTQVPQNYKKPIVLAGGLKPDNVARAITTTNVYAVDVSSGVESQAGIKDAASVNAFMNEVKNLERK